MEWAISVAPSADFILISDSASPFLNPDKESHSL
jgi:hypothetical protein